MQMPDDDETELIEDDTDYQDGMVEAVMIRRTPNDPSHPCGWKYGLHFGEVGAEDPVVRYDNSHELSKGHERHTTDGVEIIDFPGMKDLQERFDREISEWWDEH
jgi:hypothetical protein